MPGHDSALNHPLHVMPGPVPGIHVYRPGNE